MSPDLVENYEHVILTRMNLKQEVFKPFNAHTKTDVLAADPFSASHISENSLPKL